MTDDTQQYNIEARWNAFKWVGVSLIVAAGLTAIVYFIGGYNTQAYEETTKRVESCVAAGGSWVDTYDLCINNGSEK